MGDFRMKIEAVGGHGCDRGGVPGSTLNSCGKMNCPDCLFAEFVMRVKHAGIHVNVAEFTHWPADLPGYTPEGEVKDDYTEDDAPYKYYPYGIRAVGRRISGSFKG